MHGLVTYLLPASLSERSTHCGSVARRLKCREGVHQISGTLGRRAGGLRLIAPRTTVEKALGEIRRTRGQQLAA